MKALVVAALMALISGGAVAQQLCAPYEKMSQALGDKFQERSIGSGVGSSGIRMELFTSKDGSTWTVVGVQGNGRSCVLMDGVSWEPVARPFLPASPSEVGK